MKTERIPQGADLWISVKSDKVIGLIKNGDVLKAEIIKKTDDGSFLISTKKGLFRAASKLELKQGGHLRVRAELSESQLTFRVLDYKPPEELILEKRIAALLRSLNPQNTALKELFIQTSDKKLKALLPELGKIEAILKHIETLNEGTTTLKESIRNSGLFLENTLKNSLTSNRLERLINHDLKAVLLKLKAHIDSISKEKGLNRELLNLRDTVDKLIQTIEYYQFKSKVDQSIQLFIPFLWKDLKDGSLEFRKTKGTPKNPLYHCIIKLTLVSYGKLLVVVTEETGSIHIGMFAERDSLVKLLKKHSSVLKERLHDRGVKLKNLTIESQMKLDSIERSITRGLNLRV